MGSRGVGAEARVRVGRVSGRRLAGKRGVGFLQNGWSAGAVARARVGGVSGIRISGKDGVGFLQGGDGFPTCLFSPGIDYELVLGRGRGKGRRGLENKSFRAINQAL